MPRGATRKQDFIKTGEKATGAKVINANPGDDDLSPVDKGRDFIKQGET